MNKVFFFACVVGFLAIQNVQSKAVPKAASNTPAAQAVGENDFAKKTQEIIKKTEEFFDGKLPDTQEILNSVQKASEQFVTGIKDFTDSIKGKISENKEEIDKVLTQVSTTLHNTSENIQNKLLGPDGKKKVEDIKEHFTQQLKVATTQIEQLGEALKPEADKIKSDILSAADVFLQTLDKAADNLKTALTPAKTAEAH